MTIRLLAAYGIYPANAIVTIDSGTEAGLIAAKMASANLTGGVVYVPPVLPNQFRTTSLVLDGAGNVLGLAGPNNTIITLGGGASITKPFTPVAPTLTAMANAISVAYTIPADGGNAITSAEFLGSDGATTALTGSPQTIAKTAGASITGRVRFRNSFDWSDFSPVSNSVQPTSGTAAPAVLSAAAITGTPQQGVPLAITGATFSGSPTPTVTRVIRMDGTQVASGTQSTGYTPLVGDVGKIPSVTDTASNGVGSAAVSTGAGAAVIAAAGGVTNNAIVSSSSFPTALLSCPAAIGCQIPHVASPEGDISNLVFTDQRTFINDSFVAFYSTANNTADSAWRKYVEYPIGTFTPVLYGGAAPMVIGNTKRTITSDPLAITIPAGATWFEHTLNLSGVTVDCAAIELPASSAALGTLHAKYATSGNAPAHQTAGTASTFYFGSSLITGTVAAANVKSHVILADSLGFGTGDVTGVGAKGSSGMIPRVFDKTGKPYAKFAKGGMGVQHFVALFASANGDLDPYFALLNASATHVANLYGVNDLRLNRTQTQLFADYATVNAKFSGKAMALTTLTPRTDSTDGWATVENQTQRNDGNWGALTSVNTGIRAGIAGITTVIETSDAASTARNSNTWPANSTTDGTHPNTARSAAVAAAITYVPA
ncbi:hypothetical protein NHH73_24940 [Oxalobacteraceae bacterium OTU3CINTB1]|nr:hypothetical protein NHH73_24940 [Oxalobacteraceae bacterium OTU3CINTB1]